MLVSFAFNIGSIGRLTINDTRIIAQIFEKIPAYCNCIGKKWQRLVNRRAEEKKLFDTLVEEEKKEEVRKERGYIFECHVLGGGMSGNAVLFCQKLLAGCGYNLREAERAGNLSGVFNSACYILSHFRL